MKKVVIMLLILSAGIASCKNNEESDQDNSTVKEGAITIETVKLKDLKNSRVKDVLYAMYWNLMAGKNSEKDSHTFVNKKAYEYLQEVIANEELIVVQKGTCESGYDCPDTKYRFKIKAKMNRPDYGEFVDDGAIIQKFADKEVLGWEIIKSLFDGSDDVYHKEIFSALDEILSKVFDIFYMTEEIGEIKTYFQLTESVFYFMGQDHAFQATVLPADKIRYENDRFYIYTVEEYLPPAGMHD